MQRQVILLVLLKTPPLIYLSIQSLKYALYFVFFLVLLFLYECCRNKYMWTQKETMPQRLVFVLSNRDNVKVSDFAETLIFSDINSIFNSVTFTCHH